MFLSQFPIHTMRDQPKNAVKVSHKLMIRSGIIRQLVSGVYTWMPIGLIALQNIISLVKKEIENIGAVELLMPSIQPSELWKKSGRWEKFGNELLRIYDRNNKELCYAPTHEEVVVSIFKETMKSYKEFPKTVYQVQTKFRDEIRPRFGVMRSREFLMKDAYSIHLDEKSLKKTYYDMYDAYSKIFRDLNLNFEPTAADTGIIGGKFSHEFNIITQGNSTNIDSEINEESNNIEVGHIFALGDIYTKKFEYSVSDKSGKKIYPLMGCYGIGVSRLVAAIIESNYDERGIIWPSIIAPFQIVIIPKNIDEDLYNTAQKIYNELKNVNLRVLIDDRKERVGIKFADMDLIGIPHRIFVGDEAIEGKVEYKNRREKSTHSWNISDVVQNLLNILN